MSSAWGLDCPLPLRDYPRVLLAHGGGGQLMQDLLEGLIVPTLCADPASGAHDAAVLEPTGGRLALTSDAFVVRPLEFPGGDIGTLAVNGTVNDLAMAGARPHSLTVSLILEEGLLMERLWRLLRSLRATADAVGVRVVSGDTKVVERGRGDGVYVSTTGIGLVPADIEIHPRRIEFGDAVLVSGDLGRHGIAVLAEREGLGFETPIVSDCASLAGLVAELVAARIALHCLRDITRGGLASVVNELARAAGCGMELDEAALPVAAGVTAACDLLGLDPLYVACEGRCVIVVPASAVEAALTVLRQHPLGRDAALIGHVTDQRGRVILKSRLGTRRVLDLPSGEQLPRIC